MPFSGNLFKCMVIIALNMIIIAAPLLVLPSMIFNYLASMINESFLSVQHVEIMNSSTIPTIMATIVIKNPSPLSIDVKYLNYTAYIDESILGYGYVKPSTLNPQKLNVLNALFFITCENSMLQSLVNDIFNGYRTTIAIDVRDVHGTFIVHLPFIGEVSHDIDVKCKRLQVDVSSAVNKLKSEVYEQFKVVGFTLSEETAQVNVTMVNPLPVSMTISDIAVNIELAERNVSVSYFINNSITLPPSSTPIVPIEAQALFEKISEITMGIFQSNLQNLTTISKLRERVLENFTVLLSWSATISVFSYNLRFEDVFVDRFSLERFIDFKVTDFKKYDAHHQEIDVEVSYLFNVMPCNEGFLSDLVDYVKRRAEVTILNISGVLKEKTRNITITPFCLLTPFKMKLSDMPRTISTALKIAVDNETLNYIANKLWSKYSFSGRANYLFSVENLTLLISLPENYTEEIKINLTRRPVSSSTYPFTYIEVVDISNPSIDVVKGEVFVDIKLFMYNPLEVGVYLRVINGYSILVVFKCLIHDVIIGEARLKYPIYIPPLSSRCINVRVKISGSGVAHLILDYLKKKVNIGIHKLIANIQIIHILYILELYGHRGTYSQM